MAPTTRASGPLARADAGTRKQRLFLRFDIGADRYVLAASHIVRMLPEMPLKSLPAAPAWVAGILLYGETPVPVIDVSALAMGQASAARASTRIAVVDYRAAADEPARPLGLLLEHATETVHYDPADFLPCGVDNRNARYLGPVHADAQGMVQWVRIDDLLPVTVRGQLFQDAEREVAAS
jgi:chemotaxis-related protein WspB